MKFKNLNESFENRYGAVEDLSSEEMNSISPDYIKKSCGKIATNEGYEGAENCYYIIYKDPDGLQCQALTKATDSEVVEELLYDEYMSSGDDIEIINIENIGEEDFANMVSEFKTSDGYGHLLKVIDESREKFATNLEEARTHSAANWREIRSSLDTKKLDEVTLKVEKILDKTKTVTSYLYRRRYKPDWISLLFKAYPKNYWDDEDFDSDNFDVKSLRVALKPALLEVKKQVPEVGNIGFVAGSYGAEILFYVNMPYEAFKAEGKEIPQGTESANDYDNDEYYQSEADYWREMQSYGYDPESDID